jgi:hypothetical protein
MEDDLPLEARASKNAATAIRIDSQGQKAAAIEYYKRACNNLFALASIYRNNLGFVRLWTERANAYQNRAKALKRKNLQLISGIAVAFAILCQNYVDVEA